MLESRCKMIKTDSEIPPEKNFEQQLELSNAALPIFKLPLLSSSILFNHTQNVSSLNSDGTKAESNDVAATLLFDSPASVSNSFPEFDISNILPSKSFIDNILSNNNNNNDSSAIFKTKSAKLFNNKVIQLRKKLEIDLSQSSILNKKITIIYNYKT